MALTDFPAAIQELLQEGFLVREMEEGLDSVLAYRGLCVRETFPGRIGETMTRTRKGRRSPTTDPLDPTTMDNNFDNGMTVAGADTYSIEQYTFTLSAYGQTLNLNVMQEQAGIADQFVANACNNGVAAAQSLERICRKKLFSAYLGGSTRVIVRPPDTGTVTGSSATAASINNAASGNLNVDDIRGFLTVMVNGVPTTPSASNPLLVTIVKVDGTQITGQIEAAGVEFTYASGKTAANVTTTPDARPGYITFKNTSGTTYTVAAGDAVYANNGPAIFRAGGRKHMGQLVGGDLLTLALVQDVTAYLRDNAVPPMADGTYWCILDNTSMRQLFADQDFKNLYAGRQDTPEWKNQDVVRLAGITFIPTTEAYVQNQQDVATTADPPTTTGIKIRRPIVAGAECIIQGDFEGMETWLAERGFDRNDSNIVMIDGVLQIVREPLDRLQQIVGMSWHWIGDFAVPTDITATNTIIPTASNALYKRCAVIEHAG